LMTGLAPNGPIDSPTDGTRKPNDPNRNSVFITQTQEQSTTAGKSGDLTN